MSESSLVTVRLAVASDLDTLTIHNYISRERIGRMIEQSQFAIAETNGEPVGFAGLDWLMAVHPFLAMIWVFKEHRPNGVGAALLRFLELRCGESGFEVLHSSSQADEPEPQAWHRRMGFEECGIIAGFNHGVGEVIFRKRLRHSEQNTESAAMRWDRDR